MLHSAYQSDYNRKNLQGTQFNHLSRIQGIFLPFCFCFCFCRGLAVVNQVCFNSWRWSCRPPCKALWGSICIKSLFFAQLPPWRDCGGRQGKCFLEGIAQIWYPPGSCASCDAPILLAFWPALVKWMGLQSGKGATVSGSFSLVAVK